MLWVIKLKISPSLPVLLLQWLLSLLLGFSLPCLLCYVLLLVLLSLAFLRCSVRCLLRVDRDAG